MKTVLPILLLTFSPAVLADWTEFSTKANGDVHFYDNSRVEKDGAEITVWTRVRYKTSVMAAQSYESLLRLDCSAHTQTILQDTFFTDKEWTTPAMATNKNEKPKTVVHEGSVTFVLIGLLCGV